MYCSGLIGGAGGDKPAQEGGSMYEGRDVVVDIKMFKESAGLSVRVQFNTER